MVFRTHSLIHQGAIRKIEIAYSCTDKTSHSKYVAGHWMVFDEYPHSVLRAPQWLEAAAQVKRR